MSSILALLTRNPLALALGVALALALTALSWVWVQRASLESALESAQTRIGVIVQERDQLRGIIRRNESAVAALRYEQQAVESDYAQLRAQIESESYETCLDAVNRALGHGLQPTPGQD